MMITDDACGRRNMRGKTDEEGNGDNVSRAIMQHQKQERKRRANECRMNKQ